MQKIVKVSGPADRDTDIADGNKNGYAFTTTSSINATSGLVKAYEYYADPLVDAALQPFGTGSRHFYLDSDDGVVYFSIGIPACSCPASKPVNN